MISSYNPVLVQAALAHMAWAQLPAGASLEAALLRMCDILRDETQRAELYRRVERIAELEMELRSLTGRERSEVTYG